MKPNQREQFQPHHQAAPASETLTITDPGSEWIIDASGCHAPLLTQQPLLADLFDTIVRDLELHMVGTPQWHQFPGAGGVTGMALLSESHLVCHTYPELQLLTLNLYCCRRRAEWPWKHELRQRFRAQHTRVLRVDRGLLEEANSS